MVAVKVGGVPLDGAGAELVAAGLGEVAEGVVGDVVGLLVGGTVAEGGVVSFVGSGEGEVLGTMTTGVPSGAVVTTTGGGRTMM